eukprot:1162021-Pelagomonas_calceolata.AAC.17
MLLIPMPPQQILTVYCAALTWPPEAIQSKQGWPHSAVAGAAACAIYKVTYGELAGDLEATESSEESNSSDGGEDGYSGSDQRLLQKKRKGRQSRPRLLGLPWVVAADALAV